MTNLWSRNAPDKFWLCSPPVDEQDLKTAIHLSIPLLGLGMRDFGDVDELLELTLGEGRFGKNHWHLSRTKRFYYFLKPAIPRSVIRILRRYYSKPGSEKISIGWPINSKYVMFQMEVMRYLLLMRKGNSLQYAPFWPDKCQFAFTLTHDIETSAGQSYVRKVADLEENLGYRSSFNFVLEKYELNYSLMQELKERGFEVGCHGLKHDGNLFNTRDEFNRRVKLINAHIKELGMVGFRAPLTHRNPEWMQELDIEYDLSFFDTDPFEPIPGGTMCIWPFFMGKFVELPYTLVQDFSLTSILGETTPRIWLEKVDFIKRYNGMALINTHPDYLIDEKNWKIYSEFLIAMKRISGHWHALPREVASWWRKRAENSLSQDNTGDYGIAQLSDGKLELL